MARREGPDGEGARAGRSGHRRPAHRGHDLRGCAARIERGLGRLDGVASASVNLAAERATVTYDPALTGPPAFAAKLADLGYAVAARTVQVTYDERAVTPAAIRDTLADEGYEVAG